MKKQLTKIEKLITIHGNTPTDAAKRRIMYLIAEYGNSRELEGRIDESKNISQDISGVYYEYEDGSRFTLEERQQHLESQKEKTQ